MLNGVIKEPNMSIQKHHYFLTAVQFAFKRDNEDGTSTVMERKMNVMVKSEKKNVDYAALERARIAAIERLVDENKVDTSNILDYIVLTMNYLGHMTDQQFMYDPRKAQAALPTQVAPNELN